MSCHSFIIIIFSASESDFCHNHSMPRSHFIHTAHLYALARSVISRNIRSCEREFGELYEISSACCCLICVVGPDRWCTQVDRKTSKEFPCAMLRGNRLHESEEVVTCHDYARLVSTWLSSIVVDHNNVSEVLQRHNKVHYRSRPASSFLLFW